MIALLKSLLFAEEQPAFRRFNELPDEIVRTIFGFTTDLGAMKPVALPLRGHTCEELLHMLHPLNGIWSAGLSLTCKRLYQMLPVNRSWQTSTALLHRTLRTYSIDSERQLDYTEYVSLNGHHNRDHMEINPILTDLLLSGCSFEFGDSPDGTYTAEVDAHVRALVKHFPTLLECTFVHVRRRIEVTAFHAACINPDVPIETVEMIMMSMQTHCPHLLKNIIRKKNGDEHEFLNGLAAGVYIDMGRSRARAITLLFGKYKLIKLLKVW